MIAHVVLFRPRADLSGPEREAFVAAFERAVGAIASITRARVGRRRVMGRRYDATAPEFPYAAILEFATEADLRAYLEHPAHEALGQQFYTASEAAMALDFELIDAAEARELLA